jgi:putative RecB family exonuclease
MAATYLQLKPNKYEGLWLSHSKVKVFKECPSKYKFNYMDRFPKKDWEHHVFGKFLHLILENFFKKKIEGSTEQNHVLMTECFKIGVDFYKDKLLAPQKEEAKQIISKYLKLLAEKNINPPNVIGAETHFWIDIDGKVLLNGFIDREQIDSDNVLHVADYKTTKEKKYVKNDFSQLRLYAFVKCIQDPSIERVRTSYIMLRHNFEALVKEFTRDEVLSVEDDLLKCAQEIAEEKLWRPNPNNLCRFCDYLDHCPEGKKSMGIKEPNFNVGEVDW